MKDILIALVGVLVLGACIYILIAGTVILILVGLALPGLVALFFAFKLWKKKYKKR